jgi:hypothetical protein
VGDIEGVEGGQAGNSIIGLDKFSFARVLAGSSGYRKLSRSLHSISLRIATAYSAMIDWVHE